MQQPAFFCLVEHIVSFPPNFYFKHTLEDDCIAVCVVYSKQFAEYLGMRFAEDIKLLMGTGKPRILINSLAFQRVQPVGQQAKAERL